MQYQSFPGTENIATSKLALQAPMSGLVENLFASLR